MSLVSLSRVRVERGGTPILADVSLAIERGERWGLVGRNGSGKTSLLDVIVGEAPIADGTRVLEPGVRITRLDQHRSLGDAVTVWDAASSAFGEVLEIGASLERQADALGQGAPAEALERYDRDLERFRRLGGYEVDARVERVLEGLGFDPVASKSKAVSVLSGGERGRLALARQLVVPADLVLLDEPTNHLDLETIAWLESHLVGLDAALLIVSHDRAFMDALCDHVVHLEAGTAFTYACGYREFVERRVEARAAQARAWAQQQKKIAKEEDFIRRNIAGQKTNQAKGRRKQLARLPRLSAPADEEGVMALRLEPAERGGDQVAVLEDLTVGVPGRPELVRDIDLVVRRHDVIGLVGPNGAGKSTLVKTILGERPPTSGTARVGASISAAYLSQELAGVDPARTIFDLIHDQRPGWDRGKVQGHLGRFGFEGETVRRKAGTLSGGERARVALALLMLSRANFLILDEPTNHLDVESIEVLEDALDGFDGTVLLVSHDRALLRSTTNRMWRIAGGALEDFAGGFAEWETRDPPSPDGVGVGGPAAGPAAAAPTAGRASSGPEGGTRADPSAPPPDAAAYRAARKERQARLRTARRAVEEAEARAHRLEEQITEIDAALHAPDLYDRADAVEEAGRLQKSLEAKRAEVAAALDAWERAAVELDELEASEEDDA
jgi:ATP-binding cassette subfamily F protein 3